MYLQNGIILISPVFKVTVTIDAFFAILRIIDHFFCSDTIFHNILLTAFNSTDLIKGP